MSVRRTFLIGEDVVNGKGRDISTAVQMGNSFDRSSSQFASISMKMKGPSVDQKMKSPAIDPQSKPAKTLKKAVKTAKKFQKESPKLQAGKGMSSSGKGVTRTKHEINNKARAVKEMKGAITEARKELKTASHTNQMTGTIMRPSLGVNATGKGTFGDTGGEYNISSGAQFDSMMSQGPGFGLASAVTDIAGASLTGITKIGFNEEQLKELEKSAAPIARDTKVAQAMYLKRNDGLVNAIGSEAANLKQEHLIASAGSSPFISARMSA